MKILLHSATSKQLDILLTDPAHAIALVGETGSGKGFAAKELAAELLDTSQEKLPIHPYVRLIDAAEIKEGIDEVRKSQSFLKMTVPGRGQIKRILIVLNIDHLRHEAQNAMLKILEEPPVDTVIILTYSKEESVLMTIKSRCTHIRLMPVTLAKAREYYSENFTVDEITKSYYLSGGQPGLMSALLSEKTDHPLVAAIEEARKLLALKRYDKLASVDSLIKNNAVSPQVLCDAIYRLLEAGYKKMAAGVDQSDAYVIVAKLKEVDRALNDLDQNVQTKLVLTRLFQKL